MNTSDFLFAQPGFFRGMAATLDIGATLTVFNESQSPEESDAKAIRSDWRVVGDDLRAAVRKYEEERAF